MNPVLLSCASAASLAAAQSSDQPQRVAPPELRVVHHLATSTTTEIGPNGLGTANQPIYDNTCGQGTIFMIVTNDATLVDDGRVPSPTSPAPHVGAFVRYRVTAFEIGYVTREIDPKLGGPGTNLRVRFWESFSNCNPLASAGEPAADFTLKALPGTSAPNQPLAVVVTVDLSGGNEFFLLADGNGSFDADAHGDRFGVGLTLFGQAGGTSVIDSGGWLVRGNPDDCAEGAGTYYAPGTSSPGSGLANQDSIWREGFPGFPPSCLNLGGFFYTSTHLRIFGDLTDCNSNAEPDAYDIASGHSTDVNANAIPDECEGPPPASYCTGGTSLAGCSPSLVFQGALSATAPSGFVIGAFGMDGARNAGLNYAFTTQSTPLGTGTSTLCVGLPRQGLFNPRTLTGGGAGTCDGAISIDVAGWAVLHPAGLGIPLAAGQALHFQAWNRDPGDPAQGVVLTDALTVTAIP